MGLLASLYSYRQREERNELENFTTEAYAHLLRAAFRHAPQAAISFLRDLYRINELEVSDLLQARVNTQRVFSGFPKDRPDLVIEHPLFCLICEHKVDAQTDEEQVNRYKKIVDHLNSHIQYDPGSGARSALISRVPGLDMENVICRSWHEVAVLVRQHFLAEPLLMVLADEFLLFLKEKRMDYQGVKPIDVLASRSFFAFRDFFWDVLNATKYQILNRNTNTDSYFGYGFLVGEREYFLCIDNVERSESGDSDFSILLTDYTEWDVAANQRRFPMNEDGFLGAPPEKQVDLLRAWVEKTVKTI